MPPALQVWLALGAVFLVMIVWLTWLTVRVSRLIAGRQRVIKALRQDQDLAELLSTAAVNLDSLTASHERLDQSHQEHRALIGQTIKHVGLVRYDAFEDVGGKLSFSAALLNENGDGLVITSINGRQDSRVYAKPVEGRRSTYALSAEEIEAIDSAF